MPWGAAALNGEILIEEIAPHRAGFRPAADIAHGRLPEQYIQKRQVGGAAFGVGGVEQRQQGIRRLLAQHFFVKASAVLICALFRPKPLKAANSPNTVPTRRGMWAVSGRNAFSSGSPR